MQTETLLYIILSGIIALLVALFQYRYKVKQKSKTTIVLTFLRFLSLFLLLLLLVNPKFDQIQVYSEKPNLILAVDNSNSISHLKQEDVALNALATLQNHTRLNERFSVQTFLFDSDLKPANTPNFQAKETNIAKALQKISEVYKTEIAPVVLVSDGNQTFGNDYAVPNTTYTQPVYPVVLGDTITYTDLSIQQLNVNRYAFLKNKFPLEAILVYQGHTPVTSKFTIRQGSTIVYSKVVDFSKTKNAAIINVTLPANQIGVSSYKATLAPLEHEKNTINNAKNFAIEVIDQQTNIAIVSSFAHPDLGALKKSIESNQQRSVTILQPADILKTIDTYQLVILYQPDYSFKNVYDVLARSKKNTFTVVGTKTNLRFLNANDTSFSHNATRETEEYQAQLNLNYAPFLVEAINFESFPPLKSYYGDVKFQVPFETILDKTILGISKKEPLLATVEVNGKRSAVLFGEGIWKWRAQSYLNETSFANFDNFVGKLVQYLATSKKRSRLEVSYESFYTGTSNLMLSAQIFDKNYQFDARASLELLLKDLNSKTEKRIPFVLKNNNYQVDLSGLKASKYDFTVRSKTQNISKSGTFEVLEYNIEQQFLNADLNRLKQLGQHTGGTTYFATQIEDVIEELLENKNYKVIQKSTKNTIPLIDWKYLLGLLILSLAVEWFLRKYNGLI